MLFVVYYDWSFCASSQHEFFSFIAHKMISSIRRCWLYLWIILISFGCASCDKPNENSTTTVKPDRETTKISLIEFDRSNLNGQVFHHRIILAAHADSIIEIDDIVDVVSFVVVQIHTHEKNVTLSYDDNASSAGSNSSLSGTNLGLVIYIKGNNSTRVAVSNKENTASHALVAVVAYTDKGCESDDVIGDRNGVRQAHQRRGHVAFTLPQARAMTSLAIMPERDKHTNGVVTWLKDMALNTLDTAPTPGGCNLEFDIEISPFQKLHLNGATVTVEGQPASAPKINGRTPSCEIHPVKLTAHRMYLPEREFSPETYFDGLLKMMTVEKIIENGQKILPAIGASSVRRVFSAYPGTGSVYAMIATHGNYSSAYVPAATYACSPLLNSSSCGNLNTTVAQALCAIVLIVGLIIAFVGHKCLGFEVVFLGAISGGIISFCILAAIGYFETSTVLGIVMCVSFLSGIGWLILSFCMGMPCVATFLAAMTLGFFVSSTVYFGIADDTPLFESDVNFWLIYTGVTLLVPLVLAILPFSSNVVCCAILGSFCIILPIDYYAGSNLKYIVINTVRRATISGFNVAVIQPPYQSTDKCLVAFLVIIAFVGIYVQVGKLKCCGCRGRRRTTVYSDWEDREPVLSAPRSGRRVLVLGERDSVRRDGYSY